MAIPCRRASRFPEEFSNWCQRVEGHEVVNVPESVVSYLRDRAAERTPFVIAHRGNSASAPENTLAAFRSALEAGAPWIELDVQRSADDVPVVIHDRTLRRTGGLRARVADLPAASMEQIDVGAWFSPRFEGERVPALRSALQVMRGRALVNIELKAGGSARARAVLLDRVIDVVRESGMESSVLLSSFDHALVSIAHYRAPSIARAVIASPVDLGRSLIRAREVRAAAIVVSRRQLRNAFAEEARRRDLPVLVFTVDNPRDLARCNRAGIAGVFTNNVAATLRLLSKGSGEN